MLGEKRQIKESRNDHTIVPVLAVRDTVHFPTLINTLHVVREPSIRALRKSVEGSRQILVLSQRDMSIEDPQTGDLYRFGTLSETLQVTPMPDGSMRAALRGIRRVKASKLIARGGNFWAEIEAVDEIDAEGVEVDAAMRLALESFAQIIELNKAVPPEAMQTVVHVDHPGALADAIAHHLPLKAAQKQELLEMLDSEARLNRALLFLKREEQVLKLNADIHKRVERELGDSQREFYLREQLRIIQEELQLREDRVGETDDYLAKIDALSLSEEVHDHFLGELRRLDRTPASSPEGMVLRNYLDTLINLPWNSSSEDHISLSEAEAILDKHHSGLREVKERILDHLAARKLNPHLTGPILCFVGPPGVGKTSLGRAVAESLGRRFYRISLGGVRDEAEIRGHRRTYVGAMPGRIIQGLRQVGTKNPVIMLDEIDKIGEDYRSDPTSALLETLDPEQNASFVDHYVEVPFDLSGAIFIATANLIESIPAALRDRMEVVRFNSYTEAERMDIGNRHLVPRAILEHALGGRIEVDPSAVELLATQYTREAGVRELNRTIAKVVRKAGRRLLEGAGTLIRITDADVVSLIGPPPASTSHVSELSCGESFGLVVSECGGDVIRVEAATMPKQGLQTTIKLTGNLGPVMKESAETAHSWLRSHLAELEISDDGKDVHIHVPEGAIPKDGPSAGITILAALVSVFTSRRLPMDVALSGEITLSGRVLPVGGIRDKILAAKKQGLKRVILSADNEADVSRHPAEIFIGMEILYVKTAMECLQLLGLKD